MDAISFANLVSDKSEHLNHHPKIIIDYDTIVESVKKTNRLVIIEEAWPLASISSEISHHIQRFAFDYLDAPVHRITCEDVPFHYAPTLIKEIIPNVEKGLKAVKSVMYR